VFSILAILVTAAGLSAMSYAAGDRIGRRGLAPAIFRAVAWTGLGLLLLNPGCPAGRSSQQPIVLLDGSLSMTAAGGRWSEARAFAAQAGEVRLFGDPAAVDDSAPRLGQSLLEPALRAATATGRPVMVVTDGEITDLAGLDPSLLRGVGVRVFPRPDNPSAGIRAVTGPERVGQGDSVSFEVEVTVSGLGVRALGLEVGEGDRTLAIVSAPVTGDGTLLAELVIPPGLLDEGEHLLYVGLRDSLDRERRDDRRLRRLVVSATPGIVLAATTPDWDARFLYRTLADVTRLPLEGYVRIRPGDWRRMTDLSPVANAIVRRQVSAADLVILRGPADPSFPSRAGALLAWPATEPSRDGLDWYLMPGEGGPVALSLAGATLDSFPPATGLAPLADTTGWIGLRAQAGRRGAARPALVGSERGGVRRVTIAAQGLWRWAFRGGSSEQAYRAMMAGLVDWLLAASDTGTAAIVPVQHVAAQGRDLAFRSTGSQPGPVAIRFQAESGEVLQDTLRFDGAGRAAVRLPPGIYTYSLPTGNGGRVAVEEWSEEWFPGPVRLSEAALGAAGPAPTSGLRERLWLFGLVILALSAEWFLRRRLGLR